MAHSFIDRIRSSLRFSDRASKITAEETLKYLRIYRGVHVPIRLLHELTTPWDRARAITAARACAAIKMGRNLRPFGRTAALLLGLPTFHEDLSIHLASDAGAARRKRNFQKVLHGNALFAESASCMVHRGYPFPQFNKDYIGTEQGQLMTAIAESALTAPPEEAFVIACSGLRRLSEIRGPAEEGPGAVMSVYVRAQWAQKIVLAMLDALPPSTRRIRQARWIIRYASVGCESVGEARLLWILRSAGIGGLVTQFEVRDELVRYRIDITLPDQRIALEFDGNGKYGQTFEEGFTVEKDERTRQVDLEVRGWNFLRFRWSHLSTPDVIIQRVEGLATTLGVKLVRGQRFPGYLSH